MRTAWLSLIALVLLVACANAADRITVVADLDPAERTVTGTVTIDCTDIAAPRSDLHLRTHTNRALSKSATISRLVVDSVDYTPSLQIKGTDLYLDLPYDAPLRAGSQIMVDFKTTLTTDSPGQLRSGDDLPLDGWFPLPAPYRHDGWQVIQYDTYKTESVADWFDFDITLHAPDSPQVIAPGFKRADVSAGYAASHFETLHTHACPLYVTSGMICDTSPWQNVQIRTYYPPRFAYVLDSLKATVYATLERMSSLVGPYPFADLTIVVMHEASRFALEQPGAVWLPAPPMHHISRSFRSVTIHEVIHQWFYAAINSSQADAPWLDEAVTCYFTDIINRQLASGRGDLLDAWGLSLDMKGSARYVARSHMDLYPAGLPAYRFIDTTGYYGTVYDKGQLVIETMMNLLGDDKEAIFWHEYYIRYLFAIPEPQDFLALADSLEADDRTPSFATLLDATKRTDFSIESLFSSPYESDDTTAASDNQQFVSTVTLDARQPLGFPVTVRVGFIDGDVFDTTFIARPGRHRLRVTRPRPALTAEIDPDYVYAVDVNLLNNSLRADLGSLAAMRLFSGVTYLIESLVSTVWGW